jgi:hypothetical protein
MAKLTVTIVVEGDYKSLSKFDEDLADFLAGDDCSIPVVTWVSKYIAGFGEDIDSNGIVFH